MATPTPLEAPASLYVGDLGHGVTDGQLFDHFSEFKTLSSVRVCRDLSTGRSLCYAYVNFISLQDAMRAIEVKNHSLLNGKMIRVMLLHRDSDARKSGLGNVFVKNLSDTIDNAQLHEMFKDSGNILSCKVVRSDDGKSRGYGFVQFETEESANVAIEKLNGSNFGGKQIYVSKFVKKTDRMVPNPDAIYTNLYMKNVDLEIKEEFLMEKFAEFGNISSLVISRDENGASKGFGFVNFENPEDASRATEALNGAQIGSKILYVARAQKKSEREQILRSQFEDKRREQILKYQGSNLYVKNINDDVTEDELREHFSQCGTITSIKLMRNEKGISKGFGFVCYSTPEEATKAVNSFHGHLYHKKPLYVAIAQRKEERQAQLQIYYAQRMAGIMGAPAVIPGPYPLYYPAPPGVVPHPGMMYQLGMRPGWGPNSFAPPMRPGFQPTPINLENNGPRPHRQNRGRMNGQMFPQGGIINGFYVPNGPNPAPPMAPYNRSNDQQRAGQVRYAPKGRGHDVEKRLSGVSSAVSGAGVEGSELLSSRLSAATLEQQKQILGERLHPLVQKNRPDLAAKITGMLLEMDNAELLLLLESPESLAAKVDQAVQVLNLSKANISGQESPHPSLLSAEVAVN